VEVRSEYETIKQVETVTEKAVLVEKFKEAVRNMNYIEKVFQIVDRLEQIPVVVPHQEEKLVEVPYILEKIVEKIVVMPQIVEVLKYVHEVTEKEELGVAVGVDVATHEQRYKMISRDLKGNLDLLLV
jgi:biotin synthase-related radical SAM superfamily protein